MRDYFFGVGEGVLMAFVVCLIAFGAANSLVPVSELAGGILFTALSFVMMIVYFRARTAAPKEKKGAPANFQHYG